MSRGRLFWELVRPYGRFAYYGLWPQRRPSYFHDAWTIPSYQLTRREPTSPERNASEKPAILFFPMTDWHVRLQRSQQLAMALAGMGYQCVYVNPHLGLEYHKPYLLDPNPRVSVHPSGVLELHVHLPQEHEFSARLLTASEISRVLAAVETLIHAERINKAILVTSLPVWLEVLQGLRARHGFPVVYDCHDLIEGFERMPPEVLSAERDLFHAADYVSFSSQYLMDLMAGRMPSLLGKASLVRNAANDGQFEICASRRHTPADPVIGYIGALDSWFDTEAVAEAARSHRGWTFELIGRVEDPRIQSLAELPNVNMVNEIPYADVPKYLSRWSAAIIPFLRNPLTMATNPIKIYEYLNAGLPVVSTRLPEIELFGNLVYLADTPADFAAAVSRAVEQDSPALASRRREAASSETWQQRATALLDLAGVGCGVETATGV